ncbi:MAG: sigma-54-dependent transcriptional regulator [Leptospirillia bacterium]
MAKHHILLVDDDPNILTTVGMRLEAFGYDVSTAADGQAAIDAVAVRVPALVLLDLRMPKMDGLEVLEVIRERHPDTEVILLTAQGSVETVVAAIKAGAYDYLEKPIDSNRLRILLQKALASRSYKKQVGELRDTLKELGRFGHLIGQSEPMGALYELIEQVANTTATVLITGESGTGKELIAHTIHDMSDRADGPFVPINCSAIMTTLWESETFGYEKGAFTGAARRHRGFIEQANGGTLFLDEVGEMGVEAQAKFLRVLENHRIKRVGGVEEFDVDIRVLAASNRDLEQAVADGDFREDLYYRLNVFTLHAPPLRERPSDIPLLARAFAAQFSEMYGKESGEVSDSAMALLKDHDWPGNVRELRNVMERATILSADPMLVAAPARQTSTDAATPAGFGRGMTIGEMEKALILETLDKAGGNKTQAARELGISLKTLHNKLGRYREEDDQEEMEQSAG